MRGCSSAGDETGAWAGGGARVATGTGRGPCYLAGVSLRQGCWAWREGRLLRGCARCDAGDAVW